MKIKGIISAAVLMFSAVLSAPTYACSTSSNGGGLLGGEGVLQTHATLNKSLDCGTYDFASANLHYGSSFTDNWKFTVAQDTTASISVYDIELNLSFPPFPSVNIIDTKNLTFSLYDDGGNLLGKAGENDTLSDLNLSTGEWYTLTVSGQVNGLLGNAFYGKLETCVAPVPLGDSAPMLGSALALLALGYRKRLVRNA